MKYRVLIEQDEDGMFVAEVPALPGCISQGRTRTEAVENVKEAIAAYLESLEAHGESTLALALSGRFHSGLTDLSTGHDRYLEECFRD